MAVNLYTDEGKRELRERYGYKKPECKLCGLLICEHSDDNVEISLDELLFLPEQINETNSRAQTRADIWLGVNGAWKTKDDR